MELPVKNCNGEDLTVYFKRFGKQEAPPTPTKGMGAADGSMRALKKM